MQVTLRNCSNGNPLGPPFQSLLTFGVGGTLTETTSTSMFFPAERGPGHGVWNRSGGNAYTASSIAYITLNGVLSMKQRIDQRIQIAHAWPQLRQRCHHPVLLCGRQPGEGRLRHSDGATLSVSKQAAYPPRRVCSVER